MSIVELALGFSWYGCFWCSTGFRSSRVCFHLLVLTVLSEELEDFPQGSNSTLRFWQYLQSCATEVVSLLAFGWWYIVCTCKLVLDLSWVQSRFGVWRVSFRQNLCAWASGVGLSFHSGFSFLWQPNSGQLLREIPCLFSRNSSSLFVKRVERQVQVKGVLLLSLAQQEWISA